MKKCLFVLSIIMCFTVALAEQEPTLESLLETFSGVEFSELHELGPVKTGEEFTKHGEDPNKEETPPHPVLSRFSADQQVAMILTKLEMTDALKASGIVLKQLAEKAMDEITDDLSEFVVDETLRINGEKAVWKVIIIEENGRKVKYCFRQKEDGTWVFKKK